MPSLQIETAPKNLVVPLDQMKDYLRVEFPDDDDLITGLVAAATDACQVFTARAFITTGYVQCLDSFPYFADTQLSQNAMPPSYYSLPLYSTTLWNYSQQIKLFRPPLQQISGLVYMASEDSQWHALTPTPPLWYPLTNYVLGAIVADGNGNSQKCTVAGTSAANAPSVSKNNIVLPIQFPATVPWNTTLNGITTEATGVAWENQGPIPQQTPIVGGSEQTQFGSFIVDTNCEPCRLFPGPAGNYWPPVLYMPNAVQIHMICGYGDDASAVPGGIQTAVMQCVSDYYENRVPVDKAGQTLPGHVKAMLWPYKVFDLCPTRG